MLNESGTLVARYTYNAWGEITYTSGSMASINPLRYRGYYYDTETGFYYLQSRYYDPVTHRFINADSIASTGQGITGTNMFAYCRNNPAIRKDAPGTNDVCAQDFNTDNNPLNDIGGPSGSGGGGGGAAASPSCVSAGASGGGAGPIGPITDPDEGDASPGIDDTTRQLQVCAETADASISGQGHVVGTYKHAVFKAEVDNLGNKSLRTEVSYKNGIEAHYGESGSVRFDVVQYNASGKPIAAYDYKSGSAVLTQSRIQHMQRVSNLDIPIYMVK